MIAFIVAFFRNLFAKEPIRLAIVRRYVDANKHFVGELYLYGSFAGVGAYRMIGASLDSLPLDITAYTLYDDPDALDLQHDFLVPLGPNTIRVGALEPADNAKVLAMVRKMPRRRIRFVVQNRFIEHILQGSQTK